MGCDRHISDDAGSFGCIESTKFGPHSSCGPCDSGVLDASTCPFLDHHCAGSNRTKMKYCQRSSANDPGKYGCYEYSDLNQWSTCGCDGCGSGCPDHELEWYDTPLPTGPATSEGPSDAADKTRNFNRQQQQEHQNRRSLLDDIESDEEFCSFESCPPHRTSNENDSGSGDDTNEDEEEPYCLSAHFPCGNEPGRVSVCHYTALLGYRELCLTEDESNMLEYYPHDYCGPCMGGLELARLLLSQWWGATDRG